MAQFDQGGNGTLHVPIDGRARRPRRRHAALPPCADQPACADVSADVSQGHRKTVHRAASPHPTTVSGMRGSRPNSRPTPRSTSKT